MFSENHGNTITTRILPLGSFSHDHRRSPVEVLYRPTRATSAMSPGDENDIGDSDLLRALRPIKTRLPERSSIRGEIGLIRRWTNPRCGSERFRRLSWATGARDPRLAPATR